MAANLQLSPLELRLVSDPGWILTKNSIIEKIIALFATLSEEYRKELPTGGPVTDEGNGRVNPSPKISKGENYRGLPYVMLDYPRMFGREDVLAIRTFFWWGRGFSVTLHLKGKWRAMFGPILKERWAELAAADFHVGVSDDEWAHEHTRENYRPILAENDLAAETPFLKISAKCGLDRWEEAHDILLDMYRVLVGVIR